MRRRGRRKLTLADASPGLQRVFWGDDNGEGGLLYYTEACMDINSRVLSVGRGLREETDRISCIKELVGKSCVKRLNAIKRLREALEDQELAFQAMEDSIKATETTSSALNSFISEITHGIQCARASVELLLERVSEKATNPEVVAGLESSSSEPESVALDDRACFIRHAAEREAFKKLQGEGLHQAEGGAPGERTDDLRLSRQVSTIEDEGVTYHTVHSLKSRISSIIHAPGMRSANLREVPRPFELSPDDYSVEFDDDLASPDPRSMPPLPKPLSRRRGYDELLPPPSRPPRRASLFSVPSSDNGRPEGSTMSAHDVIEGLTSQLSLTVPGDADSTPHDCLKSPPRSSKRKRRKKRGEDDDAETGSIKRFIMSRTIGPSGESDALARFIDSRTSPRPPMNPLGPLRTRRIGHPKSSSKRKGRQDDETSSLSRFLQSRSKRRTPRAGSESGSIARFVQSRRKKRPDEDEISLASGSIARFIESRRKKRPDEDEISLASGSIARFIESRTENRPDEDKISTPGPDEDEISLASGSIARFIQSRTENSQQQDQEEGEPAMEAASATLAAFVQQQGPRVEKSMSDSGWVRETMTRGKLALEAAKIQARMQPVEEMSSTTTSRKRSRKKKKRLSRGTPDGLLPAPSPARTAAPPRSRWRLSKSAAQRSELIKKFCEDFSVPEPTRHQTRGAPPFAQSSAVFHCPFTELDIAIQVDKVEDFLQF